MEVVSLPAAGTARVRQEGVELEVDVSLVEGLKPGDYVIVHAGFAIEILDLEEAGQRLALFRQLEEAVRDPGGPGSGETGP
jgi:hydrogenase expression/formation protein HypC